MPPLWQHQKRLLDNNPNRVLAVHGLGSGKTRTACEWAKKRAPAIPLIVTPKGLRENWHRECLKWKLKDAVIVSKEEFKKQCKDFHHKVLIVDEADHFASAQFKSQMSKSMRWYIKERRPHVFLATGTPYRSSAWNIFTLLWFIGIELDYRKFKYDHFIDVRMGFRNVPVPTKDSPEKVRKLLEKYADIFHIEDAFDIPEQVDEIVYTGENKYQKIAHKNNMEILPIVRFTRDHQIEAGIGISRSDSKLERVLQMAEDEAKLAVVCRYRAQLELYAKELEKAGHSVFQLHGDIKDRSGVLDKVSLSKKCVLLIQSATCEGYEAPSIGVIVFASLDYSYRNYVQLRGRFLRMNALKKNVYIHLIAGDADKAVMQAMEGKKDFDVLAFYKEKNAS